MKRTALVKLHGLFGGLALLIIATFWLSTAISELFLSSETVASVKRAIVYSFVVLVPVMAAAGATGFKLGGRSRHSLIVAKKRRMPVIGAMGVLVLIPAAIFLHFRAQAGAFDSTFYTVQAIELLAGAINLYLMGSNIRDGFAIRRRQSAKAI